MRIDWPSRQMSEVCSKITDGSHNPPKGIAFGEYLMLSSKNILDDEITIDNPRFLSKSDFEMENRRTDVTVGDVLLTIVGTVGRVAVVDERLPKFTLQRSVAVLKTERDKIEPRFLMRYLQSALEHLTNSARGVAQKGIYLNQLKTLDIPVPPIAEQKRIVAILDEAFEAIDKAKQNAEKNLQNARELFESHLQSVFTQRGEGWFETTLSEVYDVRDGTHHSPKYHSTGYPLITSKNLKRFGLSFEKVNLINKEDYDWVNERSKVDKGDVLLAMIGTIGNPVLVECDTDFAIKNVALFKVPENQSGAFLKYYLDSGLAKSKMQKEANGTTQKFVSLRYLRDFPIRIPPYRVQLEMVEKLNLFVGESNRLESVYRRKLTALDELKKSLLHRAFSGKI